jgi:hypothetical protein
LREDSGAGGTGARSQPAAREARACRWIVYNCFRIEYEGTWTSFAGVSPGGTGTISEGITGTFYGMRILRLTGEFNPQYPLSGHVADFDWQCGADGTCTGPRPSPGMYFSPITNVNSTWYEFHATSASNDTWHDTKYGYSGDITD